MSFRRAPHGLRATYAETGGASPAGRGGRSRRRQRTQPHEFHRLPREQLRRRDPAARERLPLVEAIRQRHARTARPAAVHHRPRPTVDLDAGGRSRTRIGPSTGPRGPQQLRPRRAAGAHRRHQSVAAGPVHGPMEGRRGLGALGGAVAAQRPHERGIHRAALAHRRHHRAHGGARGRLRGSRHAVQRADDRVEHRHADGRRGDSDVAVPALCGRPDFDLRQRRAAVGHPSRAGRRLAIPARRNLRLHAQGCLVDHRDARRGGDVPQSRRDAETRTVRPRGGQRGPRAAARRRAPAGREPDAGHRVGVGRGGRQHGALPPRHPGRHLRRDVVHRRGTRPGRTGRGRRAAETARRRKGDPRKPDCAED